MAIRKYAWLLCLFLSFYSIAQAQHSNIVRAGLIRSQGTISPSYRLADKQAYFYLHGNLEVFLESRVSLVGDYFYGLGNISGGKDIYQYNHNVFWGANYHFTQKSNDFYLGVQPGLSLIKLNAAENNLSKSTAGVSPLLSAVAGYNYYANQFLHFFLQGRIVTGKHYRDIQKDLSELRFSAGLGFNINALN